MNLCTTSGIELSIDPDISISQIIQIHFRYNSTSGIPNNSTSGFSKSFQINANTALTLPIVVLHCYRSLLGNTCRNSHFSQRYWVSRLYELRSVRNLHHRITLLRASKEVYNVDLLWIRGSEVIEYQSPKILTPDLAEPRDPPGTNRYELSADTGSTRISSKYSGPPGPHGSPRDPSGSPGLTSPPRSHLGSCLHI